MMKKNVSCGVNLLIRRFEVMVVCIHLMLLVSAKVTLRMGAVLVLVTRQFETETAPYWGTLVW